MYLNIFLYITMGQRKVQFVNGEIYHIITKSIEELNLFRDKKDFLRMIHDLFEFNDINPVLSVFRTKYYRNKINVTRKDLVTLVKDEK